MWSRRLLQSLNTSASSQCCIRIQQNFFNNLPLTYNTEKDPAPYFFSPKVQKLLKHLTRPDNAKIFRKRTYHDDTRLAPPEYKFMTDAQLQEEFEKAKVRAEQLLQMPPVVKVHEPTERILSNDVALKGLTSVKYVFTDVSFGINNKERTCVIREPGGILKYADYDLHKKMNQIYFPMKGRLLKDPSFFTDELLFMSLLEKNQYEFLLDTACMQYDPDELNYHTITAKVYQHCDMKSSYELLRSTRHFGPMTFYLTWHNTIDGLILELLQNGAIKECVSLISLQRIIHPGMVQSDESGILVDEILQMGKSEDPKRISDKEIELVEKCINCLDNYIMKNSTRKGYQELALQAFRDLYKQRVDLERGIRQAHGVN